MSVEEPTIVLRPLEASDHAALVALQLRCFPTMKPWKEQQFLSQIRTFPEGQIGLFVEGELVGSSASLVVDYAEYAAWHDWKAIADDGFIRNHDPDGDTLYGIELQVDPAFRGRKLARRLYTRRKELCRELNLERMVIGGRIPGYAARRDEMSAQAYVDAVVDRRVVDPVLTAQLANGFALRGVVADYLPSDEDSAGYATILEWVNLGYVPSRRERHRRAVFPVRVGLVQYPMRRVESFEDFATQVEYYVDTASDYRCDFLVFPELFSLQLLSILEPGPAPAQARALAGFAGRYREMFRDLALRYDVNLVGGSTFVEEEDGLYNVAMLFRRDGTVAEQKKIHITPSEAKWWGVRGGDRVDVFDTDRGKVAMLVCYDSEFPELGRVLAARGARLLFVPFNTNDRQGFLRVRQCAHARCIENHLYAVIAGCVGHLPRVENADLHYACSAILTPCDVAFPADGIAAQCAPAIEELIVQDLDLEHLRRHRATGTVRNWDDRRMDLYAVRMGDEEF
ncbi:MAG: GNAT family N-acetyltransferase [Alphaproteobacteria bacterium]|nr:GNAT family N-acetyltransferase [Alphaproteobacteria bacterium]